MKTRNRLISLTTLLMLSYANIQAQEHKYLINEDMTAHNTVNTMPIDDFYKQYAQLRDELDQLIKELEIRHSRKDAVDSNIETLLSINNIKNEGKLIIITKLPQGLLVADLLITDPFGRIIKERSCKTDERFSLQRTLLTEGMYTIELFDDNKLIDKMEFYMSKF